MNTTTIPNDAAAAPAGHVNGRSHAAALGSILDVV
jgi:hypothetical protein